MMCPKQSNNLFQCNHELIGLAFLTYSSIKLNSIGSQKITTNKTISDTYLPLHIKHTAASYHYSIAILLAINIASPLR